MHITKVHRVNNQVVEWPSVQPTVAKMATDSKPVIRKPVILLEPYIIITKSLCTYDTLRLSDTVSSVSVFGLIKSRKSYVEINTSQTAELFHKTLNIKVQQLDLSQNCRLMLQAVVSVHKQL